MLQSSKSRQLAILTLLMLPRPAMDTSESLVERCAKKLVLTRGREHTLDNTQCTLLHCLNTVR